MKNKTPERIDLRKQFKFLYSPSAREVETIDVPELKFIMVDGSGDTTSDAFQNAIQTLYNLSFTTKFAMKKKEAIDYPVMALEGLWWTKSSEVFDLQSARKDWNWTLMIMQPDLVTEDRLASTVEQIKERGKSVVPFRLAAFHEGLSAQTMHIGPYSAEAPTIERIHDFLRQNGYVANGKHHEICLGDPRRAHPSKLRTILRTILRQPIRRA